jgi:hypothetical protein
LQASVEFVFVQALQCASQFAGSRRLRGRELARGAAHVLGQMPELIAHLLAIVDHFVNFLGGRIGHLLAAGASGILLSHQIAHFVGLLLLLSSHLLGRLRHLIEAAGGVLLLRSAEQASGLAKAIRRAPGIGRAGILPGGALHVFVSLAQAIERLLCGLLPAIGGLLLRLPGTRGAGR